MTQLVSHLNCSTVSSPSFWLSMFVISCSSCAIVSICLMYTLSFLYGRKH